MSLSRFAQTVLIDAIGAELTSSTGDKESTYTVTLPITGDNVMEAEFTFSKPIPLDVLEERLPKIFAYAEEQLDSGSIGIINTILSKYGLADTVGTRSAKGSVNFEVESGTTPTGASVIRTLKGRFISHTNFVGIVNLLFREYMLEHMTSPGPQLHNRTGRFISTSVIRGVDVLNSATGGRSIIQVRYDYMKRPYSVFDPANGNPMSSSARNPNNIITTAIEKALADLISPKQYKVNIIGE